MAAKYLVMVKLSVNKWLLPSGQLERWWFLVRKYNEKLYFFTGEVLEDEDGIGEVWSQEIEEAARFDCFQSANFVKWVFGMQEASIIERLESGKSKMEGRVSAIWERPADYWAVEFPENPPNQQEPYG